ncbi:MAG: hypothetical protein K2N38_06585 [Oscillospiraceae bacterium]|nr:hypothetical protein [Oscillospiraceae bacterium]
MVFKCRCCNSIVDEKPSLADGFSELAYDMEWLEVGQPVPPLEEHVWLRSDKIPEVGERRFIKVRPPFSQNIGDSFNVLYSPALSSNNGWEEYPEELSSSAVVGCVYEKTVGADEFCAWIEVTVENVIPFPELYKHYPCRKVSSLFEGGFGEYAKLSFRWQNWEFYTFSAQGDCGEWRLIFIDSEGKRHLLMFYEWGWHDGFVQLGNAVQE